VAGFFFVYEYILVRNSCTLSSSDNRQKVM
jgi:hypothetical protein